MRARVLVRSLDLRWNSCSYPDPVAGVLGLMGVGIFAFQQAYRMQGKWDRPPRVSCIDPHETPGTAKMAAKEGAL